MKRPLILLLLAFVFSGVYATNPFLRSQEKTGPKFFYFGPGLLIGGFYPSDVNDFLSSYYSNISDQVGTTDMMLYMGINATGSFFFTPYTELQADAEWVFSPKFVSVNGETDYFTLRRLTPALKFNFHIPIGRKVSYFIGLGGSYSFVSFKTPGDDYSGKTPGGSFQTGVFIRFGKMGIEPGITVNFINADVDDSKFSGLEKLNYTGAHIGCKVLF